MQATRDQTAPGLMPMEGEPSVEHLRFGAAMSHAMVIAVPAYQTFTQQCHESAINARVRREPCIRLAQRMATGGDLMDRLIGLSVWHRLVEGKAAEAEVITRKRQLRWQMEMGAPLLQGDWTSWASLDALLVQMLTPDNSELRAMQDAMREANIARDPPPQWMPKSPEVLQARR